MWNSCWIAQVSESLCVKLSLQYAFVVWGYSNVLSVIVHLVSNFILWRRYDRFSAIVPESNPFLVTSHSAIRRLTRVIRCLWSLTYNYMTIVVNIHLWCFTIDDVIGFLYVRVFQSLGVVLYVLVCACFRVWVWCCTCCPRNTDVD